MVTHVVQSFKLKGAFMYNSPSHDFRPYFDRWIRNLTMSLKKKKYHYNPLYSEVKKMMRIIKFPDFNTELSTIHVEVPPQPEKTMT